MKTLVVGILALIFVLGFDASTFARGGGGGGPSSGMGGQERSMDRPRADRDADRDRDKNKDRDRDDIKKDNQHSNKGGKLRGLDRADEVAGEHGDKGRDTAEQKQGK
jgi:hypothetical protein